MTSSTAGHSRRLTSGGKAEHGQALLRSSFSSVRMKLFSFIKLRQLLFQVFYFRHVVDDDLGFVRIVREIILMISLRVVEGLQWRYLSDNRSIKNFRPIKLFDVGLGNFLLLLIGVEDRRTVLRTAVGSLTI